MLLPRAEAGARAPLRAPTKSPPAAVPRIVALGGGTGLPALLRGLRQARRTGPGRAAREDRECLTAIVTVADDGGSSGRLREAYGILAPGDIRNCLLALSDGDPTLATLFGYRFNGRGDVAGHSLGNLILAALSQLESRFDRAVDRAGDLLGAQGRVLPATSAAVGLVAELVDGSRVEGESRITTVGRPIRILRLEPCDAPPLPQALAAVEAADCVVIGPGSLYTSLIPVLLVRGLTDAIARSGARVVLVMNLMTQPGETNGYSARDHLRALRAHAPIPVHDVILNDTAVPEALRQRYASEGAVPLTVEASALDAFGCGIWTGDLLAAGEQVRHDPQKLARAVLDVAARPWPARGRA
jgi:uncharacterized cofD-like protein